MKSVQRNIYQKYLKHKNLTILNYWSLTQNKIMGLVIENDAGHVCNVVLAIIKITVVTVETI